MQITKKIILNTNNDRPNSRVIIKQGSIGTITLVVTINDKGGVLALPTGTTAKVRMLKPDKKQVLNDCIVSGNNVNVEITQQMQAMAGEGQCEIILLRSGKTLTTATFPIMIEKNVHDDSEIESTPEYNTLLNSLIRIEDVSSQLAEKVNQVVFNVNTGNLEFYKDTTLAYAIPLAQAISNQDIRNYIDTLVSNGTIAGVTLQKGTVTPELTSFAITGKNLFDKSKATSGYHVGATSGNLNASANYFATDFIPVIAGQSYVWTQHRQLAFYNSSKVFVSGINTNDPNYTTGSVATYVVPDGVSYIRLSGYLSVIDRCQFEKDVVQTSYEPFSYKFSGVKTNYNDIYNIPVNNYPMLNGKTIAFLGDSYTYTPTGYTAKIASMSGCISLNYGVPSSRVSIDKVGEPTVLSFLNRYNDMPNDIDACVIFGGINDANEIGMGGITLGDMNSPLDTTTFYGALKLLCENLIKKYLTKKIIGIIPPDVQYGAYYIANMPSIQTACREVYEKYGIPYCDLKKNCFKMGTMPELVAMYRLAVDNIHGNDAGHLAMAEVILGELQTMII